VCTKSGCTYIFFKKNIFWKQIRMSLVLEYNWHETAVHVFTKHKLILLAWENSLKYSAWQLSFALSYKWCYIEKILKTWQYPTMDGQRTRFFSPNVNKPLQTVTLDIPIQFEVLEYIRNFCSCSGYVFVTRSLVFERREHNTGTCTRGSRTHTTSLGSVNREQDGGWRNIE
jgi:hypothetical protein